MKDISSHILDIVQNSISANANNIRIDLDKDIINNTLKLKIKDNGNGMSKEFLAKVSDPYSTTRTTRKVGMGLALLKQHAERTNGNFKINSEINSGTEVIAKFEYDNIDRQPIGDIVGTLILLVAGNPKLEFEYNHIYNHFKYTFNTKEIKDALGDMEISNPLIRKYLKEMIIENINEIENKSK
ncbi:MAG: ATP-binding protein [Bacteroidota bacterium]|nr:ATP-binding protein [Bacteroidota bacterium]